MATSRAADTLGAQLAALSATDDAALAAALAALLHAAPDRRRAQPAVVWAPAPFAPADEPAAELLPRAVARLAEPVADVVSLRQLSVRSADLLGRVAVEAARVASSQGTQTRPALTLAVRFLTALVGKTWPGQSIELRVPPVSAVQLGHPQAGPVHTRGTPPNVVETDAATFLALATGGLTWADALRAHRVSASGNRSDLGWLLPITAPAAGSPARTG